MPLILVPSELLDSRVAGVIVQPCDQSWKPPCDRHEENKRPRGVPEGRKAGNEWLAEREP